MRCKRTSGRSGCCLLGSAVFSSSRARSRRSRCRGSRGSGGGGRTFSRAVREAQRRGHCMQQTCDEPTVPGAALSMRPPCHAPPPCLLYMFCRPQIALLFSASAPALPDLLRQVQGGGWRPGVGAPGCTPGHRPHGLAGSGERGYRVLGTCNNAHTPSHCVQHDGGTVDIATRATSCWCRRAAARRRRAGAAGRRKLVNSPERAVVLYVHYLGHVR